MKISVESQKNIWILLKLLETLLNYKLRKFQTVFTFFLFCLTLSVPKKLKNSIFEMPTVPQTLNINNLRATSAKSTIRKLIKHYLKNICVKAMFSHIHYFFMSYSLSLEFTTSLELTNK